MKLPTGSWTAVQSALHFLYGQLPTIGENNAKDILETAEFLMIDELKAYCIEKLKTVHITLENCLILKSLSSRFSFTIAKAAEFYRSHIPELLQTEDMLRIDKDSLCALLSDKSLSYVGADSYLTFVLKWVTYIPDRTSCIYELLAYLVEDETKVNALKSIHFENIKDVESLTTVNELKGMISESLNEPHNVFVLFPPNELLEFDEFHVYNLDTSLWYKLPIKRKRHLNVTNVVAIRDTGTIIALTPSGRELCFYDLANSKTSTKRIQLEDESKDSRKSHLNIIQITTKVVYGVCVSEVEILKPMAINPPLSSPRRAKSSPKRNTCDSPSKCDSPKRNKCDSPKRNKCDSPRRNTCDSPKRNKCDSPRRNTCDSPKRNKCDSPRRNTCDSPKRNKCDSPRRNQSDIQDKRFVERYMHTTPVSTLYSAENVAGDTICLKPILSVESEIESFCVAGDLVFLLVSRKKQLLIYSTVVQNITTIDLSNYDLYNARCVSAAVDNRVYLMTESKIVQINLTTHSDDITTTIFEFDIDDTLTTDLSFVLHKFAYDKIISIRALSNGETKAHYQNIPENITNFSNELLTEFEMPLKLKWNQMSQFLLTKLPRRTLRCQIDCPHCNK